MSDENTIVSSLLTATVKSLKMIDMIQKKQEQMAQNVEQMQRNQEADKQTLSRLGDVPTLDDLSTVHTHIMKHLSTKNDMIDNRKAIVEHVTDESKATNKIITDSTRALSDEHTTMNKLIVDSAQALSDEHSNTNKLIMERAQSVLTAMSDQTQTLTTLVEQMDSNANHETLTQLVDGLKNMNNNLIEVANRIIKLSANVTGARKDTRGLAGTVIESNSRVTSIDMRVAALMELSEGDTPDMSDTLEFLSKLESDEQIHFDGPELDDDDEEEFLGRHAEGLVKIDTSETKSDEDGEAEVIDDSLELTDKSENDDPFGVPNEDDIAMMAMIKNIGNDVGDIGDDQIIE